MQKKFTCLKMHTVNTETAAPPPWISHLLFS